MQSARWRIAAVVATGVIPLVFILPYFRQASAVRPDLPVFPAITSTDRILIMAPHEDDEALGCGGLILKALSAGATVRVVYLTHGDHNQLAFIAYRKRPWLSPTINRNMGEVRRREAINAMGHLGLHERDLVFLGYPDFDTLAIWEQHWGDAPPLYSILTNTTRVPYANAYSFGKPYKGEEIVKDIEQQLLEFRPTLVFVTHPIDANSDHRSCYLFLKVALLNLNGEIPAPAVYTYPIHMGPWPWPQRYQPDDWLPWPTRINADRHSSWIFELPQGDVQSKYEAICLYKSQMADSAYWLASFARRNEIFSAPRPVALSEEPSSQRKAGSTAKTESYEKEKPARHPAGVSYSQSDAELIARVDLERPIELDLGVSIYAFGYSKTVPFAAMPKIHMKWFLGRLHVFDQEKLIVDAPVKVHATSTHIIFAIPWKLLGEPQLVFAQANGLMREIPVSQTAWEVLTSNSFQTPANTP